jgi:L-ascorbate metabolism protein UlaG (beta-lactamase superfamily)
MLEPVVLKKLAGSVPFDVVLLPINGRDEKRHRAGIIGNMDAREAAAFASKLQAKLLIPTHFDMFAGNGADLAGFVCVLKNTYPLASYYLPELGKIIRYTKRDDEVR